MHRPWAHALRLMIFLSAGWLAGCAGVPTDPTAADTLRWWRGNTHTHSYWSDGNACPEAIAARYRDLGYDFLVLSDHNILSRGERWFPISETGSRPLRDTHVEALRQRFGDDWVEVRTSAAGKRELRLKTLEEVRSVLEEPGRFILIEGEEITDRFGKSEVHINGLNLEEVIPPQHGDSLRDTIQRNIDAVIEQGRRLGRPVLAHLNHPNFQWSLTPLDVAHIRGERFFEVYNGHRGVENHGDETRPGTENMWDIALTVRLTELDLPPLFGLATDDAHNHHAPDQVSIPGRGWVMVESATLTPDSIIQAMRAGAFYSSTGVVLEEVLRDGNGIRLKIRGEPGISYETRFVGSRRWDAEKEGVTPAVGELFARSQSLTPKYKFRGDELYVRAVVISSRMHPDPYAAGDFESAWIQPVVPAPSPAAPTAR